MTSVGSLVRVLELFPPPDAPTRADGDWKRFTSVNGFAPPEDYRMLIREYGAGTFANWMQLIEPFNHRWSFMELAEAECRSLRGSRHHQPDWPIWPEPGGFLPWATTASGDLIGWRTIGRPNSWTILFWGRDGTCSSEFAIGAIDFLIGLAERSLGDPTFDAARSSPFRIRGQTPFVPAGA